MRRTSVLLLFLAACGGGISVGALDQPATIFGRVVNEAGRPMDGVQVTLHPHREVIARAETDSDGAFELSGPFEGRVSLVAYAGGDRGRVIEVSALSGTAVDVGDVQLGSLNLQPEVLELRDVGYDELLTELPMGVSGTLRLSEERWLLVSVPGRGPGPGTVAVLDVDGSIRLEPWAEIEVGSSFIGGLSRLADESVLLSVGAETGGLEHWWLTPEGAHALGNGRLVAVHVDDGVLFALWEDDEGWSVSSMDRTGVREDRRLDLEGWVFDHDARPDGTQRSERVVLVESATGGLYAYDLVLDRRTAIGERDRLDWAVRLRDGRMVAALAPQDGRQTILRVDGSEIATLAELECRSADCSQFMGASDTTVYFRALGQSGLRALDVAGGAIARIEHPNVRHPELRDACMAVDAPRFGCWVREVVPGRLRYLVLRCGENGCAVDVTTEGETRVVPVDLQGNLRTRLFSGPSSDAHVRPDSTGHRQVYVAPMGAPVADFVSATHFRTDHYFIGFGSGERWVYGLMRDPRTGLIQVMRAPVAQ